MLSDITNTTPTGTPCGSPPGTPIKMPPTPKRPFRLSFGGASPPKKGRTVVGQEFPESPRSVDVGLLGEGSFGKVSKKEVNGVSYAEKIFNTPRSRKNADEENSYLSSPGCIPGVSATCKGKDVLVLPLCESIDYSKMSDDDKASMLESIDSCPLFVLNDVKPENMMRLAKGTPIPQYVDGEWSFAEKASKRRSVVVDLTPCRDPEDGDSQWSPCISVEEMERPHEEMRKYKSAMMLEYIRLCEAGLLEGQIELKMEEFKKALEHTMWPHKF